MLSSLMALLIFQWIQLYQIYQNSQQQNWGKEEGIDRILPPKVLIVLSLIRSWQQKNWFSNVIKLEMFWVWSQYWLHLKTTTEKIICIKLVFANRMNLWAHDTEQTEMLTYTWVKKIFLTLTWSTWRQNFGFIHACCLANIAGWCLRYGYKIL